MAGRLRWRTFGVIVLLASVLLVSGCTMQSEPKVDEDARVVGQIGDGIAHIRGHPFDLPEGTGAVVACVAAPELAPLTLEIGPRSGTFRMFQDLESGDCIRVDHGVESLEWKVKVRSDNEGTYEVRLWFRSLAWL